MNYLIKDLLIKKIINNTNEYQIYYIKKNEIKNSKVFDYLTKNIYRLTKKAWGDFGIKFIKKHILESDYLILLYNKNLIKGFLSLNEKKVINQKYYYIEFLVIDPEIQKIGLSKELIKLALKKIFLTNILKGRLFINIITISPNPKIIGMISRRSSEMYPNPEEFINNKLPKASDKYWKIANIILKDSWNPNRKLDREGLVLHNSYKHMPWLIYKPNNVPHDKDIKINIFCNSYLNYKKETGNEFIIIAKLNIYKI
jgi:hypothetical protein